MHPTVERRKVWNCLILSRFLLEVLQVSLPIFPFIFFLSALVEVWYTFIFSFTHIFSSSYTTGASLYFVRCIVMPFSLSKLVKFERDGFRDVFLSLGLFLL